MKKSDISGWKNVFSFTFIQHYKSKSAVIALVITCLLVIISGPVITMLIGSGATEKISELGECKIEEVYLKNETDFIFDSEKFIQENEQYSKVKFTDTDESVKSLEEKFEQDSSKDIILHIYFKDEKYNMDFYRSNDSEISVLDTGVFSDSAEDFFVSSRISQSGISDETKELIESEITANVIDISDISDKDEDDGINAVTSIVTIIYACVIMMIVLISSQQIAASIVVEKSSKVIETLLLSARPLAIIVGKIIGTMLILVCDFAAILVSAGISGVITTVMTAKKISEAADIVLNSMNSMSTGIPQDAIMPSDMNISIGRIIFGVIAVIVTTVLAFLFYSVISGISGASCNSMEDLSGASAFISLSTIIGVYIAMGVSMVNNAVFTEFSYLFPFSGIYVVPVDYIFGRAELSDIFILWGELIILTAVLFRFAAKIYHVLIFHKGERIKLKYMLSISKSQKGQGR